MSETTNPITEHQILQHPNPQWSHCKNLKSYMKTLRLNTKLEVIHVSEAFNWALQGLNYKGSMDRLQHGTQRWYKINCLIWWQRGITIKNAHHTIFVICKLSVDMPREISRHIGWQNNGYGSGWPYHGIKDKSLLFPKACFTVSK